MRNLNPSRNQYTALLFAFLILIVISAGKAVSLITDFLWFGELRFTTVFGRILLSQIACGCAVGALAAIVIAGNILIARMSPYQEHAAYSFKALLRGQYLPLLSVLSRYLVLLALIIAVLMGIGGSSLWETFLRYRAAVPFGAQDPLFHRDIRYYVFTIPFYKSIFSLAVALMVFSLTGVLLTYQMRGSISVHAGKIRIPFPVKIHLLALACLAALLFAVYFHLKIFSLVNGQNTLINGAGYARVTFYLPYLYFMRALSLLLVPFILATAGTRSFKPLAGGCLFVALCIPAGEGVVRLIQNFIVAPNELIKETRYIGWNIAQTRAAFNLDNIYNVEFTPTDNLDQTRISDNGLTIQNIRLWEQAPLLTTYSQLQEIRTYYEFLDVDNDRYLIDGETRQVMLSPRELVPDNLPSRIWINEHLTYTHGYGLCLGPVNSVTAEGLPDFFIKNIPPVSSNTVSVSRPQIYFGEAATNYAIVKTRNMEFDYPSGSENIYTEYDGNGGVRLNGFLKRLLFVIRFNEMKILLSGDITRDSRIMFHRQILQRVKRIAPFLTYDSDPYLIIARDGTLKWMIDGYTTTHAYPYSAPVKDVGNYIRNSVKIIVDAYDGTVDFYIADPADPIIRTYDRIFPKLLKPFDLMPEDLRAHIRYPQTLFTVQAIVYATYHMNDPQVFYNKEDIWKIAQSFTDGGATSIQPYYTVMKLAGIGEQEEFILMVPFSPAKKDNMIAWLAARCDEPNYGKLQVFNFPKQKLVYGPQQIEARINQDAEISKQLTLWNQGGSRVIRGSLLVIPVEQSLLYVQPLYIAATDGGGVPELKRVIVAYGNSIAMEDNLDKSLQLIFGGTFQLQHESAGYAPIQQSTADLKFLITEANRYYTEAQLRLSQRDFAGYGEAIRQVERLLKEMATRSSEVE